MAQRNLCRLPMSLWLFLLVLQLRGTLSDAAVASNSQYILVFDAGSTKTRLTVFELLLDSSRASGLKLVGQKDKDVSPGLSAYANAPERLRSVLSPLMDFAKSSVPANLHSRTIAIVRATAGLRLLGENQRASIIRVVAEVLRRSAFNIPESNSDAVRVITGQEEAMFGWVSVNFLMGTFDQPSGDTYGLLDLGGGSTQIAFVPMVDDPADSGRVVFTTASGRSYPLYTRSYLGLGMSQMTLNIVGYDILPKLPLYASPCMNLRFIGNFSFGPVTIRVGGNAHDFSDLDRFALCSALSSASLRVSTLPQVQVPPKAKVSKFVAVGAYYYTARMLQKGGFLLKKIPGEITIKNLQEAGQRVCPNPPVSGKFEPYVCINSAYISQLLEGSFQFPASQSVQFLDKIRGYSASWTLGLAINRLSKEGRVRAIAKRAAASD